MKPDTTDHRRFRFRRPFSHGLSMTLVIVASVARAGVQAAYTTSDEAFAGAQAARSQITSADRCIAGAVRENEDNVKEATRIVKKIVDLRAEQKASLAELRSGYYCSRCYRTASEIEKTGVTFARHLSDVKGQPIPAPADVIQRKMQEYNDRIKQEANSLQRCNNTYRALRERYEKCASERDQAVLTAALAEASGQRLKAQEELKKEGTVTFPNPAPSAPPSQQEGKITDDIARQAQSILVGKRGDHLSPVSAAGVAQIQAEEKLKDTIYDDGTGRLTVGYGHLLTAAEREKWPLGTKIDEATAKALFAQDLARLSARVDAVLVQQNVYGLLTQEQRDALYDFAFNEGSLKELPRNLTPGRLDKIPDQLLLYDKAYVAPDYSLPSGVTYVRDDQGNIVTNGGGMYKVRLDGLANRRAREREKWLKFSRTRIIP